MKKSVLAAFLAGFPLVAAQTSLAVCPVDDFTAGDGSTDLTMSASNPLNGYPENILDTDGNTVELCLDGPPLCIADPVEVGNPFSETIGFGAEGFWYLAAATIDDTAGGGISGFVEGALEAAFNPETIADGNQFPFNRLRIRIDLGPFNALDWVITHPWGAERFNAVVVGPGRDINESFDIDFLATVPNGGVATDGRTGPMVIWDADAPVGYLGDPTVNHTVTGSPCGTNFFRIAAFQAGTNIPVDINGGAAGDVLQTDLFSVMGKRFTGQITTPVTVTRASYTRPSSGGQGRVNIYATSSSAATVTTEANPELPVATMAQNGAEFFQSYVVANTQLDLPTSVVTRANIVGNATFREGAAVTALTDEVTIKVAEWNAVNNVLRIFASSSDHFAPPTLTGSSGLGTIPSGRLYSVGSVTVPPAELTVTSSAGGGATKLIQIVEPSTIILFTPPTFNGTNKDE